MRVHETDVHATLMGGTVPKSVCFCLVNVIEDIRKDICPFGSIGALYVLLPALSQIDWELSPLASFVMPETLVRQVMTSEAS